MVLSVKVGVLKNIDMEWGPRMGDNSRVSKDGFCLGPTEVFGFWMTCHALEVKAKEGSSSVASGVF